MRIVETYDIFEYLLALTHADIVGGNWMPPGRYWWHWEYKDNPPSKDLLDRGRALGAEWPLLKGGFFGGTVERLEAVEP